MPCRIQISSQNCSMIPPIETTFQAHSHRYWIIFHNFILRWLGSIVKKSSFLWKDHSTVNRIQVYHLALLAINYTLFPMFTLISQTNMRSLHDKLRQLLKVIPSGTCMAVNFALHDDVEHPFNLDT